MSVWDPTIKYIYYSIIVFLPQAWEKTGAGGGSVSWDIMSLSERSAPPGIRTGLLWRNTNMNRRFIRRTAGGSRMRYSRRRMKRRAQESKKQDGSLMKRVSGLKGAESFVAEQSAGHEFVPVFEIALVKKEIRKHPPGGDAL